MSTGTKLLETLDLLRLRLNKSGIERTVGMKNSMELGEDCYLYKKSLDIFLRDDFEEIKKKAEKIGNLEFISNIPSKKIYKYYSEASILINTSSSEGFPNTFLESWANYTPIVSLNFDPDNIISKYTLGLHSKNFDELKENTQKLIGNTYLRKKWESTASIMSKKNMKLTKL